MKIYNDKQQRLYTYRQLAEKLGYSYEYLKQKINKNSLKGYTQVKVDSHYFFIKDI